MIFRNAFVLTILITSNHIVSAGEPQPLPSKEVKPTGEFAGIDARSSVELLKQLDSADRAVQTKAIDQVKMSPNKFAPPVLYALSNAMFKQGQKDDSLFWFYLGQLRARSDANKCKDESARSAVQALNVRFGPIINQYAMRNTKIDYKKNMQDLKALTTTVVDWDRKHKREYDPRWISLHGMDAFLTEKVEFEPQTDWDKINEQTRVDYLKGLDEAAAVLAKMDKNGDGAISEVEVAAFRPQ